MKEEAVAFSVAISLKEERAHWHLVKVCVVRQQTFIILARSHDEFRADDDIALIMNFLAAAVCISQAFSNATVDWANDVALLEPVASEERNAFRLRQAKRTIK